MMSETKTRNYRWVVMALLFFATSINYLDRQVLSYLKPTLEKEFGWDNVPFMATSIVFSNYFTRLGCFLPDG